MFELKKCCQLNIFSHINDLFFPSVKIIILFYQFIFFYSIYFNFIFSSEVSLARSAFFMLSKISYLFEQCLAGVHALLIRRSSLRLDCGGGFTMQWEGIILTGTSRIRIPLFPNVANFARRAPWNMLGRDTLYSELYSLVRIERTSQTKTFVVQSNWNIGD